MTYLGLHVTSGAGGGSTTTVTGERLHRLHSSSGTHRVGIHLSTLSASLSVGSFVRADHSITVKVDILRLLVDAVALCHGEPLGKETAHTGIIGRHAGLAQMSLSRSERGALVDYTSREKFRFVGLVMRSLSLTNLRPNPPIPPNPEAPPLP